MTSSRSHNNDEGLTMEHHELIAQQCINQSATTPYEVARFSVAYMEAFHEDKFSDDWKRFVIHYGSMIEPINEYGYRIVPLAQPAFTVAPHLVVHALENLYVAMSEQAITPLEAYKEFETIHPYLDGNGRLGHLLWAKYTQVVFGHWPMELPPNVFANVK